MMSLRLRQQLLQGTVKPLGELLEIQRICISS